MLASLVMTVIGPDRPGLVQAVAACVADHGGNWLESRMCHLGGQFAGVLRVEVDAGQRDGLVRTLQGLEASGLRVIVHAGDGRSEMGNAGSGQGTVARLELVCQDRGELEAEGFEKQSIAFGEGVGLPDPDRADDGDGLGVPLRGRRRRYQGGRDDRGGFERSGGQDSGFGPGGAGYVMFQNCPASLDHRFFHGSCCRQLADEVAGALRIDQLFGDGSKGFGRRTI